MKKRNSFQRLAALTVLALTSHSAYSVVIMTLTPTPTGAHLSITGSFDYSDLGTYAASFGTTNNFIVDDFPIIAFRSDGTLSLDDGSMLASTGTGSSGDAIVGNITAEFPYVGDVIAGWGYSGTAIAFPADYVSGSEISLSGNYTGPIFESNGGTMIPGQAQSVSFSNGESIIFTTGRAIPEPSSAALVLPGLLLATRRQRKH